MKQKLTWKSIKHKNGLTDTQLRCIKLAYKEFLKNRFSIRELKEIVYNHGRDLCKVYKGQLRRRRKLRRGGFIIAILAAIASAIAAAASTVAPVIAVAAPIVAEAALAAGTAALVDHIAQS